MLNEVLDRASLQSGANAALALTLSPAVKHQGSILLIHSVEAAATTAFSADTISITRTAHTGTAADDRIIFTVSFTGTDFIWPPSNSPQLDLYLFPDETLVLTVPALGGTDTSFGVIYYEVVR